MAFPNNCSPRLIQVDESCGCTLTRADIRAMTPQDFEDQAFKEVYMDRVIGQTKEARMTGVKQRSLTDLFLSRTVPIRMANLAAQGQSIIAPYVLIPQRSNVNANHFLVTAGTATSGAGTGGIHAGSWDLTVQNEASQFASNLVGLEKYFLPGRFIAVLFKDPTSQVGRSVQLLITSSVNADAGGVSKAKVTAVPSYTAAGWTALSAGDKAIQQPTHGVLVPLANSVSNYESWCYQDPAENTMKLLVFWLQTMRRTHCYNDEFLKALTAPLTSEFFKKFRQLPIAMQRKRQEELAEFAKYNTIFYGREINEKQTVETYRDLPQVVDPANPNCVLEFKSNTLGLWRQLEACGRVTDMQGATMDMDLLKTILYSLKRHRGGATRIDAMTDRYTADRILYVMVDYYKTRYGVNVERFYNPKQEISFEGQVLWNYNVYDFPEEGLQLAVIVDEYFDDYLSAFPVADKTRGRALWLIDWSDFQIGLAGTASATRQTNVADNLYNCVITPNVNHYQLNSETIAAMLQDPNRHAIIHNFNDHCPSITKTPCSTGS